MLRREFFIAAALAATALLASSTPSQAGYKLDLKSGADEVIFNLGPTGTPTVIYNPNSTVVSFTSAFSDGQNANFVNLTFAGYKIFLQGDITNTPGNSQLGTLQLNNLAITNQSNTAGAGGLGTDLIISLTATDYTAPGTPGQRNVNSAFTAIFGGQATANSGIKLETFYDEDNGEFTAQADAEVYKGVQFIAPVGSDASSGSPLGNGGNAVGGGYSLTDKITISGLATGGVITQASAEVDVTPVPAPAGLILVATVVPFFGLLRRRMKTVPTA